jgi:hypothetical protein
MRLKARDFRRNCIRIGLKEIEEDDYVLKTLDKLDLLKKWLQNIVEENTFIARDKVSKSLIQKGL